jgi:hypothetical protein
MHLSLCAASHGRTINAAADGTVPRNNSVIGTLFGHVN